MTASAVRPDAGEPHADSWVRVLGRQLDSFGTAMQEGRPVTPSARDTLVNMAVIETCYRSAAEQRPVGRGEIEALLTPATAPMHA